MTRLHWMFALMCLIWGSTWIAMKVGVTALPPVLFAGTRFVAAGALLLGWAQVSGLSPGALARSRWRALLLPGLLVITATYGLLFWGVRHVPVGLAAVTNLGFIPVGLLALAVLHREERLTRAKAAAVALGLAGLLLLFAPGGGARDPLAAWGLLAVLGGTLAFCWGSVLSRPLVQRHAPVLVSGLHCLAGGIALLGLSALLETGQADALRLAASPAVAVSWAYLVLAALAAFTMYLRLVDAWGPSTAGSYAFVSPVLALLLGAAVFGERPALHEGLGAAVLLVAAWLAVRARAG